MTDQPIPTSVRLPEDLESWIRTVAYEERKTKTQVIIEGLERARADMAIIEAIKELKERIRDYDNGRCEGQYFAEELDTILTAHGSGASE